MVKQPHPQSVAIRLGVLGWPVAHSLSPRIQNAALEAAGLAGWRYQLLPVPPDLLAPTVRALEGAGFRGVNVTIPHKRAALALADEASPVARAVGAANTLLFERGLIHAENTDAPGLIAALPIDPRGVSALILGAGGSARAAVWALREAGASEVRVWNRTAERARSLSRELGAVAVAEPGPADVLVNCTPVGMTQTTAPCASGADPAGRSRAAGGSIPTPPQGSIPTPPVKSIPLAADEVTMFRCVVDFAYGHAETPLIGAARAAGIPAVDGLDLLVAQGALSFERFTGLAAPVEAMRRAARGG
jgi:shikimate dehydrogenase